MTELIVRFLIPVICGYLVFVALSNQFQPWRKPAKLNLRPRWLLGCCCGAAVTFCMMVLIHFSFGKSIQELMVLAAPLGIVFLTLIAGSTMAWLGYRKRCATHEQDSFEAAFTGNTSSDLNQIESTCEAESETTFAVSDPLSTTATAEASSNSQPSASRSETSGTDDTRPLGKVDRDFLKQARKLAKQQYDMRCKVEKNLRITRKALVKLEAERYRNDAEKSDKQLHLENELHDQVRRTAKVENKLLHEADRMSQLEARLAESKDLVVQAKAELRTNMEARTNAILTARKSVNFARRSMETRDRAKRKLDNLQVQLDIQSQTTSKVIKALELEKQKNRDLSAKILSLQGEQELAGLRKIQRAKPATKPWLSRVTKDKAGTSRLVRKVAEHEAGEPIGQDAGDKVVKSLSGIKKGFAEKGIIGKGKTKKVVPNTEDREVSEA